MIFFCVIYKNSIYKLQTGKTALPHKQFLSLQLHKLRIQLILNMLITIRSIFRALKMVLTCLYHLIPLLIVSAIKGHSLTRALEVRKNFCQSALRMLNMELEIIGKPYNATPAVFISNHRSYIDPVAALRDIKALPVAKAEVAKWPLIGYAARATGIMYVKREDKSSRRTTLVAMEKTLEMGYSVLIYPEGTTTKEPTTLPFKKGAFGLAVNNKVPIVPMAISYNNPDAIWDGPESFISHLLQMLRQKKTRIKIRYGEPIYSDDNKILLAATQNWINEQVKEMEASW